MLRALPQSPWTGDPRARASSRRIPIRRLLPLLAALAVACDGDAGTGPELASPAPTVVGVEDPRGDTFGTDLSAGLVQPDIVRFTATQGNGELVLVVEFANPVQPVRESPNAAAGLIDVDTDRNSATGMDSAADAYRPEDTGTAGLGVDVGVIVLPDAGVIVIDTDTGAQETLRAEFAGRTITVRLPYASIGGDGDVNLAAVFGTLPEPTDLVPNSGHVAVQAAGGAVRGAVQPGPGEAGVWPREWSRR